VSPLPHHRGIHVGISAGVGSGGGRLDPALDHVRDYRHDARPVRDARDPPRDQDRDGRQRPSAAVAAAGSVAATVIDDAARGHRPLGGLVRREVRHRPGHAARERRAGPPVQRSDPPSSSRRLAQSIAPE